MPVFLTVSILVLLKINFSSLCFSLVFPLFLHNLQVISDKLFLKIFFLAEILKYFFQHFQISFDCKSKNIMEYFNISRWSSEFWNSLKMCYKNNLNGVSNKQNRLNKSANKNCVTRRKLSVQTVDQISLR